MNVYTILILFSNEDIVQIYDFIRIFIAVMNYYDIIL